MTELRESAVLGGVERRFSRRGVLRGGALAVSGLATAALVGCGGDDKPADVGGASSTPAASAPNQVKVYKDPALPYAYSFPEPDKPVKKGGTFKVAVNWDFATQDTTKGAGSGTIVVPNIVYNRLLGHVRGTNPIYNPFKLQLEPEVAKSWELSPDGMVHTFRIQPNVKWQNVKPLNGRAFTAADVKFTYERYASTGVNTQYFVNVATFEAPDPLTLRVTMKRPTADFLVPLGSFYTTLHPKELVDDGSIDKTAVGTGPMIVKDMQPAQLITFTKNPDYWEREVLLDGAELKIVLDASARLAAFRTAQVDYSNGIFNRLSEVQAIVRTNPDVQINMGAQTRGTGMALIMDNPKWHDVRVRRAIALAIDTEKLRTVLYEGMAKKLPVFDWSFLFNEEPTIGTGAFGKWWRYDPQEAKSLLIAAGQENLSFTDEYYPYTPQNTQQSEMLVDQFRDVGITMKSSLQEYTTFNSQWVGRKLKEASSVGWAAGGYDADNYFYNHVRTDAPGNRWKISDPEIDKWADAQQVELNPEKRRELLRKIWDRDLDMMYRPPLVNQLSFEVYQPWVRALRYDGLGVNGFYYSLGDQIAGVWLDK